MPDRQLALQFGARAERAMRYADLLQVAPGAYASTETLHTLDQATQADPSLADPWWDLAVIAARFEGDYDKAGRHLKVALELGYQHSMMPALKALVDRRPPPPPTAADAASRWRQLVLDLAVQAESPDEALLHDESAAGEDISAARPSTFASYVNQARQLCAGGAVDVAAADAVLAVAGHLQGDTREYVLDLLRRVAPEFGEPALAQRAADAHVRTLVEMAFATFARDPAAARRSRRAAERGLAAIAEAPWLERSEPHADLLIARGQALYYQGKGWEAEAIRCYRQALAIKRECGNAADAERLADLLRKQIHHRIGRGVVGGYIGLEAGQAAELLRVCVEVAADIGDAALAAATRLALADLLHELGRREESEALLVELLDAEASPQVHWGARFTLASIYSETARPRQAAELQRELLDAAGEHNEHDRSVLWSNYANSLRLCGDLDSAWSALETSWALMPAESKAPPPGRAPTELVRMKLLFAQLAKERGDLPTALRYVDEAEQVGDGGGEFGLAQVRATELKAGVLLASGSYDAAAAGLDAAAQNLRAVLAKGQNFETWEGLFRRWSSLDGMAVQAHAKRAGGVGKLDALLRAEGAKGRVLSWLATRDPAAAATVLDPQRQQSALARMREWLGADARRRVVSLFAGQHGIGVFSLHGEAGIEGDWLDHVDYDELREGVYLPFVRTVDEGLSRGEMPLLRVSSALLEHLLAMVGSWLWRTLPALADGGGELVLVPHRLLRALPLAHAMLPTGKRLSELFDAVWTAPSLDLALVEVEAGAPAAAATNGRGLQAVVDPDGSLAFAVAEAMASTDAVNVRHGAAATAVALNSVLGGDEISLVSMHGTFDAGDPFSHRIVAADRDVELRDFVLQGTPVRSPAVFLGVCEAGLQRQSVSDEPIGFPALLLQAGAQAVVAPLWKVDDFASLHFMTRCLADIGGGVPVARAASASAAWMRSATPNVIIAATDAVMATVNERLATDDAPLLDRIRDRLARQRQWLHRLPRDARPFGNAVDWAAFQVTRRVPVPIIQTEA